MKKLLGLASLLMIALLTACTADNLGEIAEAGKDAMSSESDRVPVVLSISSTSTATTEVTRAPLPLEDNAGNFSTPAGQYLGVFALAQTNTPAGGQSGPVSTNDIQWDGSVSMARALWNQPMTATYANNSTTLQFIDKATLSSTPAATSCYYPITSWYNYYFYTYYPRVDDSSVHVSSNVVTADYTLDGSQDIITAVSQPATNPNSGYCSKYVRENPTAKPQLELNHHLAQLRFFVCSKKTPRGTFQVKGIKLLRVPKQWSLTIADKANVSNTGKMVSRDTTKADIPVRMMTVDINDNSMTSASDAEVYVNDYADDLTKTKKCAGYAMVPTTEMITTANSTLNRQFRDSLQVQIITNSNDTIKTHLRTFKADGGFEAGKVYNVILTISQGGGSQTGGDDPLAVDLGLSVLWAKVNIGANIEDPEDVDETERGLMFTWGGTTGYSSANPVTDGHDFKRENDPLWRALRGKWKKYGDGAKLVLDNTEDAASVTWGGTWRMPTKAEYDELIANTSRTWYANYQGSGIAGVLFTSTKTGYTDKSIFMPVSGYRTRTSFSNYNTYGYYWSATVYTGNSYDNAWHLTFNSSSANTARANYRYYGLPVRAVKPKN